MDNQKKKIFTNQALRSGKTQNDCNLFSIFFTRKTFNSKTNNHKKYPFFKLSKTHYLNSSYVGPTWMHGQSHKPGKLYKREKRKEKWGHKKWWKEKWNSPWSVWRCLLVLFFFLFFFLTETVRICLVRLFVKNCF